MKKLNELTLKQREELFRQLRISITHHSNAMEGTTLSFGETKELLKNGNTSDLPDSVKEIYLEAASISTL